MKSKIIVILGSTATGKSDLAVQIAKKLSGLNHFSSKNGRPSGSSGLGEVISADSRQVYKGLDIGTGKITKREMQGVPHHMLDVISPKKQFTVADFQRLAHQKIAEILKRGKVPIICGGTGFYIDAVVKNLVLPNVAPNSKLRIRNYELGIEKLHAMLEKLDPKRAKEIDKNNKVRLIRAIEIATALGKVPKVKSKPLYDALQIGIQIDSEVLKERINKRLLSRIKSGMIKEAQILHKQGLSWKRMEELGLEYRYLALFLQKKISKEQMILELQNKIGQYARRQRQWFKRDKSIHWIDPKDTRKTEKIISDFLNTK